MGLLLHPAQKTIVSDTHRFRVVNCGRRFGKTVLAVEEMIGVAIAKNDRRVLYYAPTRDDAREIVWSMLMNRCNPIITYSNETRLEVKVRTQEGGESLITLYGWESVKERGKGRGLSNDFIVFDEVAQYRGFWEGWNDVLSPTLIDRVGSALFISTPKGFNHFYDLYNLENKNQDYKSFHFTSYDNPFIPRSEIERERDTKTEDSFSQEYMADFRKTEGLVYKEFEREKHLTDSKPTSIVEKLVGIDWGYTNPTAVLTILRDYDDTYWVMSEWYHREKTTKDIVEYAASLQANAYYPDPAEPDRIEEMRRSRLNVREVNKDVVAGIDAVRHLFKNNKIKIHNSCTNLIQELETYSYKEKRVNSNEPEEPIKENDHAVDVLRYVLFMQAGLKRGNKVHQYIPKYR